jgi:hypothetical protein
MSSPSTPRHRPLTDINDQIRDVMTLLRIFLIRLPTCHILFRFGCIFAFHNLLLSDLSIAPHSHLFLGDSEREIQPSP